MLASGHLVTASEVEHSDLFWALRGAGMSFGIVTSLKFRTFAAPPETVLFYYPYSWNETQARVAWEVWQEYCGGFTTPQIPAELNIRWIIGADAGIIIFLLEGAYHGSVDDFAMAIAPLLDALDAIGGLLPIPGYGTHLLGWLDSLLYANNNDLVVGAGTGEPLETPLNYSAVPSKRSKFGCTQLTIYSILLSYAQSTTFIKFLF